MKIHSTFVTPALSLALTAEEKSASACRLVLTPRDVAAVARQLSLTEGRVRQWRRAGEGSPTLTQIFAAPAFGAALLASAGPMLGAIDLGTVSIRERLYLAMVALGEATRASAGKRGLDDYSEEELKEQAQRARDLEREGKAIADACERELVERRQRALEASKGVR